MASYTLSRSPHLWTVPFWLRRRTLATFVILYGLLLAALIVLYHFSELHHGIRPEITQNHYSWTYGPNAVFAILALFWNRVDEEVALLAPWQVMTKGFRGASDTILLDYISPTIPVKLFRSLKSRHWAVFSAIGVTLLLKLITVFTTGLLVLSPTQNTDSNFPFIASTSFNASQYEKSRYQERYWVALRSYWGITQRNLSYPAGTSHDVLYQTFHSQDSLPSDPVVKITSKAIYPKIDCEIADVTYEIPTVHQAYTSQVWTALANLTTPSCTGSHQVALSTCDVYMGGCPPVQYGAVMTSIDCQGTNQSLFQVNMAGMRYTQNTTFDSNSTEPLAEMIGVAALICNMTYTAHDVQIRYQGDPKSAAQHDILVNAPSSQDPGTIVPGVDSDVLMTLWPQAVSDTSYGTDPPVPGGFWGLMAAAVGKNSSDYSSFIDGEVLKSTLTEVYTGTATQLMREVLVVQSNDTVRGSVVHIQERLIASAVSTIAMAVILILLLPIGLLMVFFLPRSPTPRKPEGIRSLALLMSSSRDTLRVLEGMGHALPEQLAVALEKFDFRTTASARPIRQFEVENIMSSSPRRESLTRPKWLSRFGRQQAGKETKWHPFSTKIWVVTATLVLPIAVIVALQVVQHYSDERQGFIGLHGDITLKSSIASYIATAILYLIVFLFDAFKSNADVFGPYLALRSDESFWKTAKSRKQKLLGQFKKGHLAAQLLAIDKLLAGLLTIVVSGLYTINPVTGAVDVKMLQADSISPVWNNSVDGDNNASSITALIWYDSSAYPQYTYQDLAFPELGRLQDSNSGDINTTNSQLRLPSYPAYRARLNCSVLDPATYNITHSTYTKEDGHTTIRFFSLDTKIELPEVCQFGGNSGDEPFLDFEQDFENTLADGGWFGYLRDLHVGPLTENDMAAGESNTSLPDNPMGCPSLGFWFGWSNGTAPVAENTTALYCYQLLEKVETDVTLTYPDLTFASAPVVNNDSVKLLDNGTAGFYARQYRIEDNMITLWADNQSSTVDTDAFFSALTDHPQYDLASFVGRENASHLIDAISDLYGIYMAQAMNFNMRQSLTDSDSTSLPATITSETRYRLAQNSVSKWVLQGILAFMAISAAVAYIILWPMRTILMHQPTSIAGAASLLAGSRLMKSGLVIPQGAETMSDKELVAARTAGDRARIRLGWWTNDGLPAEEGQGRFGIDIVPDGDGNESDHETETETTSLAPGDTLGHHESEAPKRQSRISSRRQPSVSTIHSHSATGSDIEMLSLSDLGSRSIVGSIRRSLRWEDPDAQEQDGHWRSGESREEGDSLLRS